MARRINSKCVACAQMSVAKARQLHGKTGDDCWDENRCHRRRSHYRNRQGLNEKRRSAHCEVICLAKFDISK
ncbi:MAG: hypothetical protein AAGI69_13720 [Cyanobacteria bacterium P01_H01_bin.21]